MDEIDLETVDTDSLLWELQNRFNGVFFVGREYREKDFRFYTSGGTITDLLGLVEIGKDYLLETDRKSRHAV